MIKISKTSSSICIARAMSQFVSNRSEKDGKPAKTVVRCFDGVHRVKHGKSSRGERISVRSDRLCLAGLAKSETPRAQRSTGLEELSPSLARTSDVYLPICP